ncbi:FMN-binding protein [Treponema pedis]|uniref:Na(+)-translocating NADH-quinone reductase subunit C n=2 Tax=Treponema pedis TaxID=409322 RepID=S5ZZH2_9SPIR|nr:FMN-binding protein [Treponema pedis]AGT43668.1 Na(+)-translocating NADH-quinone reductase subunit C [Treponema pedis str. T A4]QOW61199.1 FMN-binding protein [Treponema pedis]QSI04447.1 FMN-binding protein [Treponema pedis]
MKQTIKLAFTLAAYAVIACIALAAVYNFTAPKIEEVKFEKTKKALQAVFPEADDFKEITSDFPEENGKIKFINAYLALKDGKNTGLTLTVSGPTYSKATVLIAINLDKTVKAIKFLELTDTPGLGSRAAEDPFISQFKGKALSSSFKVKEDVEAISGATITSNGVSAMLKAGAEAAITYMDKNNLAEGGSK